MIRYIFRYPSLLAGWLVGCWYFVFSLGVSGVWVCFNLSVLFSVPSWFSFRRKHYTQHFVYYTRAQRNEGPDGYTFNKFTRLLDRFNLYYKSFFFINWREIRKMEHKEATDCGDNTIIYWINSMYRVYSEVRSILVTSLPSFKHFSFGVSREWLISIRWFTSKMIEILNKQNRLWSILLRFN